MGRDHIGFAGFMGLGLVFFYAGLTRAMPLLLLIPILILHYACQNVSYFVRRRKGIVQHTEYGGEPWIAMRLMFTKSEPFAKQFGEPLIIFGLGCLMQEWSPSTAAYFWWGAAAMFFNQLVIADMDRRILDQIDNARIESEFYMEKGK
jgi:hypothetical protein